MTKNNLCKGLTEKGINCKNKVRANYCWLHQDQQTSYLSDDYIHKADIFEYRGSKGNIIWGHGPFIIKVDAGRSKHLITMEIEYPEADDYTLSKILYPIVNFYNQKLSEDKVDKLIKKLEDEKDTDSIDYEILKSARKFYQDEKTNTEKKTVIDRTQYYVGDLNGWRRVIEKFELDKDGKYSIFIGS